MPSCHAAGNVEQWPGAARVNLTCTKGDCFLRFYKNLLHPLIHPTNQPNLSLSHTHKHIYRLLPPTSSRWVRLVNHHQRNISVVTVHAGLKTRVRRAEDGGGGISERAIRNKKERKRKRTKERMKMGLISPARWLPPPPPRAATRTPSSKHSEACRAHSLSVARGDTRARAHTRRAPRCSSKGAFPPIPCQVNAKLNVSCHCCVLFRLPTTVLRITVPSCFRHPPSTLFFQNDTFFSPSVLFPWFLALIPAPCTHLSIFILSCFLPPTPVHAHRCICSFTRGDNDCLCKEGGGGTKESSFCAHMALLGRVCLSETAVKVHADWRKLPCSDPDTTTGLVLRPIVVLD